MSYDIVLLGTTPFAHKNLYLLFKHSIFANVGFIIQPIQKVQEIRPFFVHVKSTDLPFIMVYLSMFFKLYMYFFCFLK